MALCARCYGPAVVAYTARGRETRGESACEYDAPAARKWVAGAGGPVTEAALPPPTDDSAPAPATLF